MMIDPGTYKTLNADKTYEELLKERDELMEEITEFEKNPTMSSDFLPSPAVRYQCNLEYMAELCKLIAERFNDRVWEE